MIKKRWTLYYKVSGIDRWLIYPHQYWLKSTVEQEYVRILFHGMVDEHLNRSVTTIAVKDLKTGKITGEATPRV